MSDYTVGDTLYFLFTTRSFSTGEPTQLAGTPVLSVYEDNSLTQITAGVSLGVDHDSVTGLNLATIVASGANGYESGKQYSIVITTGTVGGVSVVGEVVGSFSLQKSAAAVDLANSTDGLGAIKTDTAAILTDTGTSGVIVATNNDKTGYTVSTVSDKTGYSLSASQTFDMTGNITGNLSGSVGSVTGNVGGVAGTIQTLDALDTAQDAQHATTQAAIAVVDTNVDAVLVDTADMQPKLGVPSVTISDDIAAVKSDTAATLNDTGTTIPSQISGLNDITAASVLAAGDIDGYSLENAMKLILSSAVGVLVGAATNTITIQAADGSKTRLTATVDADGNRSVVIKDATG